MRLNFQQQTTAASLSALAHLGIAYLLLASVFASPPTPPKLLPIAVTLIPPKAFAKSAVATAPAVSAAPVVEAAPPPVIPPLAAAQPEVAPPKPIPKPKPALKPKPKPDPALKSKPKPESRPKLASVARPESLIQQVEDRYMFYPCRSGKGRRWVILPLRKAGRRRCRAILNRLIRPLPAVWDTKAG